MARAFISGIDSVRYPAGGASRGHRWIAALALLLTLYGSRALGGTRVRVLDTFPAGRVITLARNQYFYLRLHYDTDQATGLWIQPLFRGRVVDAGTSPSAIHRGSGDALAWLFLLNPAAQVDEVRITGSPCFACNNIR